jgi:hypothetical protein
MAFVKKKTLIELIESRLKLSFHDDDDVDDEKKNKCCYSSYFETTSFMTIDPSEDARVGRRSRAPRHAVRPIFRQSMLRRCCLIIIKTKKGKKQFENWLTPISIPSQGD